MEQRRRSRGGFSMIELLVAMVILSTGLLGTGRLAIGVIERNLRSRDHGVATVLAQDRLEALKGLGAGGSAPTTEDYGTLSGFPRFKRVTEVRPGVPEAGLNTVTVTVYWDRDRDESSVVLRTLLDR